MASNIISNLKLRQCRWLKRTEKIVPHMVEKADKEGGIVVAQLGKKRLSDTREVVFTLEARLVSTDSGGAHKMRTL